MEIKPGDFVVAMAGREKGKCFVVLSVENQYLYLCNGKNRKLSTPKKIKIKHIKPVGCSDDFICDLLAKGEVTNKIIHHAISEIQSELKAENYR